MADGNNSDDGQQVVREWKPVPDPTALTSAAVAVATEQLRREISALDDKVTERLSGRSALVDARIQAVEMALDVFEKQVAEDGPARYEHLKEYLEGQVKAVERISDEKFLGINNQFIQRDTAVQAALQAAKEAVGEQNKSFATATSKTEAYTSEQIKALQTLIQATVQGYSTQIDDLKTRISEISAALLSIQAVSAKADTAQTTQLGSSGLVVALGGLVVTAGVGVVAAIGLILSHVGAWK